MAKKFTRTDLDAILRDDLSAFLQRTMQTIDSGANYKHNWHIDAITYHLEQCLKGEIKRLLITIPPRSLKSVCASIAFPAWALGRDPTRKLVTVSYEAGLAANFARQSRKVMESDWYKRVFPRTRLSSLKKAESEYETTGGGGRYSTSVGGALTGRGGSIIIIDDPMKPFESASEATRTSVKEWFSNTLASRLDDPKTGVIIVIMQRIHADDLAGHLLENNSAGWVHLDLPAIAIEDEDIPIGPDVLHHRMVGDVLHPERQTKEMLDATREEMGSTHFMAQYQQRPVPATGNLVKWEWFKTFIQTPAYEGGRIVQSWDTASKAGQLNDYSVCTTWLWKRPNVYLLNVFRKRMEYPELKKTALELAQKFAASTILIEDKGSGIQLLQDLRLLRRCPTPIAMTPNLDKITRMSNQTAMIEGGRVFLPQDAPWLVEYKSEMMAFPLAKHDDQVDSTSQFLEWVSQSYRRVSRSGRTIGMT